MNVFKSASIIFLLLGLVLLVMVAGFVLAYPLIRLWGPTATGVAVMGATVLAVVSSAAINRLKHRKRRSELAQVGLIIHPDELAPILPQVRQFVATSSLGGVVELWAIFSERDNIDWDRRIFKDARLVHPKPTKRQELLFRGQAPWQEIEIAMCRH